MNKASQRQTLETLERLEAVLSGHFVFASGRHGSAYVNKDAVYPHTRDISRLCYEIAKFFAYDHVQVVIAPAVGGVILSQWVAYHLTGLMKEDVLGVYA
ncbi:MAG: phosphoribosyltransferase, partial [Patescibacteria group bacterium]